MVTQTVSVQESKSVVRCGITAVMAELENKAGMSNLVQGSLSMNWSRAWAGARYAFLPSLSPARVEVSSVLVSDKYIWNKDTVYNTFQASITELLKW